MDHLSNHKRPPVKATIGATASTVLYLPPYSPDLNPIDQAYAKLKARLRTAEARTIDMFWPTIGSVVGILSPAECQHYFDAAG